LREFPTDERDERENGQRHQQREPLKGPVAEAGAAARSQGRWLI
jgi:hypothetical protein